ncbi:MAG: helix-turn-helix domain-containing protein [Candidatus Promineifilaceae bacterium]
MKKEHVKLSTAERQELQEIVKKGKQKVRVYKRALGLLELDRGKTFITVAETVGVSMNTVRSWRDNYHEVGLKCLQDKQRPGRPIVFTPEQRATVTALACSPAPEGYSQWSLRLLADKLVELDYCESISYGQVRNILKKTS